MSIFARNVIKISCKTGSYIEQHCKNKSETKFLARLE